MMYSNIGLSFRETLPLRPIIAGHKIWILLKDLLNNEQNTFQHKLAQQCYCVLNTFLWSKYLKIQSQKWIMLMTKNIRVWPDVVNGGYDVWIVGEEEVRGGGDDVRVVEAQAQAHANARDHLPSRTACARTQIHRHTHQSNRTKINKKLKKSTIK